MTRKTEACCFGKALVAAALLLCVWGCAGRADATIWRVTSAGDDPSNPAAGTLRHAINNAWNNDIITIDFYDQEIALKSEIHIQKNITIMGYGTSHPTVVRQTTAGERVFRIKAYTIVRLEYLTITGGSATATGTNPGGGGILNYGYSFTLYRCTVSGNTSAGCGGGIDNYGKVILNIAWVRNNSASQGGGVCTRDGGSCELYTSTVTGNTPDQLSGPYSANDTCTIGDAPNRSATAFAGYAGPDEPEPRPIEGDADVSEVKNALSASGSALHGALAEALSEDLGRTPAGTAMSLYYANTFEDVAVESADLSVEYTASWPAGVRYYPLFCKADGSGYEIPERGVKFEIKAGQRLPDGVTPPDFYVPGEGLMTWRNVVTDGGSYDLNPTAGVVTFRVCSVRAAEMAGDTGSGGGCNAAASAGFAPLALLFGLPLVALARRKDR